MFYEPLEDNDIRVLQFENHWHPETSSKALRLLIKTVSLDKLSFPQPELDVFTQELKSRCSSPGRDRLSPALVNHRPQPNSRFEWGEYEAVSYCWGDRRHMTFVWLNGVRKEISCDLDIALRALHRLPETRLGMNYWIDALCINQDDVEERNHQVKRIMHIYWAARAIVVWLGPETEEDTRAITAMKGTRKDISQNGRLFRPPGFAAKDWRALCAFLSKPYWNRLWIIQELTANHYSTLFLCGAKTLTREMIKLAAECCQKLLREDRPFTHNTHFDAWSISTRVYRLVELKPNLPRNKMLKKVLNLSREALASNEKDKVYGILGLLPDSISSQIIPDYSNNTSVQQAFTALTVAVIKTTGLEQIIYGSRSSTLSWPSWISDLRLPFSRKHVQYLRQCQASKDYSADYHFLDEESPLNTRLCVKGIRIDLVDGIMASQSLGDQPIYPNRSSTRYNGDVSRLLAQTMVMNHPKTFQNPVLMKTPWVVEGAGSMSGNVPSIYFLDFHRFRVINESFPINGKPFRDYFPIKRNILKGRSKISKHLTLAVVSLRGRKLVTTDTGYICLVPDIVQEGDVLVLILGCNFPILLRLYGSVYRILGECYVHGLMNGEIFHAQKEEGLQYEDFILA
ncbi:uncharacterized protein K460DRAFT_297130 [Cucurbitaria berberidis CBS 394.84]|uniref:Heterokaryon incompatibility domain-containing protein n=1 Tax=Cucurbitaria berberidis CBS 394.84 TaxID=1168544 RepID=A0A9P4G7V1_9PLEO|nr:uncharacterized protein K460DRAFT_297130 [Cucurbitaria berberidis CBS 394.84]KAF1840325.1 hypothetical protein K460DRAFT_297130 [Cucurbitaria berberidis CBS 394.84]